MRQNPLYWTQATIKLSTQDSELKEPLLAAMDQWNSVECGRLKLVFDPASENRVILRQKKDWNYGRNVLAMTVQTHFGNPAIFKKVQIEVNHNDRNWSYVDYKNVLLHELGHVFGLEHLEDFNSVMHSMGQLGDEERELTLLDKASFCELQSLDKQKYQQMAQQPTGCHQAGSVGEFSPDILLFMVLALILLGHRNFYDFSTKFSRLFRNPASRSYLCCRTIRF